MDDKAYEYYKRITKPFFVEKFSKDASLSGLTKNEIYYGGGFSKEDRKYYNESEQIEQFVVSVSVYIQEVNSFFNTEYSFSSLSAAERYYETIINELPLSRVTLKHKSSRQLRCYS